MTQKKNENILEVDGIIMRFGGLVALSNPDFTVKKGSIRAIIGPNGAGKTTLFNIITGFFPPTKGVVRFKGEAITGMKAHEISGLGITRTFQTVELFDNMTVLENVMLGCHNNTGLSFMMSGFMLPRFSRQEKQIREKACEILEFIGLEKKAEDPADSLPLGDRKILEIGRALASDPDLVCLDEPAAGLNETETQLASTLIRSIKAKGITVLLVEHDMRLIMDISDEILVINYGEKLADGPPEVIQNNERVIEAYLGDEASNA